MLQCNSVFILLIPVKEYVACLVRDACLESDEKTE